MNNKKHLNNCLDLHPDYESWENFLDNHTHLNDTHDNHKWYNVSNCHYFVNPKGYIIELFGYHGHSYWMQLTSKSHDEVYGN